MRHPRSPAGRGFTLTELLIVLAVIGVLLSLVMPTIVMIRRTAWTVVCANNQRQLALGFITYSVENGEFPTCYARTWLHPDNWSDETAGFMDAERVGTWDSLGNRVPDNLVDSAFSLVWEARYISSNVQGCQKRLSPPFAGGDDSAGPGGWGGATHWGPRWWRRNDYMYNTPAGNGFNDRAHYASGYSGIGNNSQMCGLFWLGGYATRGASHGYRIRGSNTAGPAQTAMFACPSVEKWTSAGGGMVAEPHAPERWTSIDAVSYYGSGTEGQDDLGNVYGNKPSWETAPYNRNVAYFDGHVKHIVCARGALREQW